MVRDEQLVVTATTAIWAVLDSGFFAAGLGRLVWHLRKVHKEERAFFGRELVGEVLGAGVGFIVGAGLAQYLGLDGRAAQGLILIVSYLGPDGFQAIVDRYLSGGRAK